MRRKPAAAELGSTGKLRAAINLGNPILAGRGSDGSLKGVSVDLAREAARRLGIDIELVAFPSAGNVVKAVKAREVDLAFVAIDPVRAADMEYTAPYVVIEGAYLVQNTSPLKRNEDVDQSGIRVVVGRGSAYDLFLTRELKSATLVRVATSPGSHRPVSGRSSLKSRPASSNNWRPTHSGSAGVRLLPGRFMVIEQAMGGAQGPGRGTGLAQPLHRRDESIRIRGGCADASRCGGRSRRKMNADGGCVLEIRAHRSWLTRS